MVLLLAPTSASTDWDAGFSAYDRKDFKTAFEEFKKHAQQGDADAQYFPGTMYFEGTGVPQDYVLAHMWFNLAASRVGYILRELYTKTRNAMAKKMTPSQIEEAQRLARRWKPKPGLRLEPPVIKEPSKGKNLSIFDLMEKIE